MFLTAGDCVVYHAAGAGVVCDPLTKTQSFYLEHNDDIVSLTLCRHQKLRHIVATGKNSLGTYSVLLGGGCVLLGEECVLLRGGCVLLGACIARRCDSIARSLCW